MTKNIRNFCIIAHIDHGKSTLADRLLEITNTIPKREMKEQVLDTMDIERERGITIKLQTVRMKYKAKDGHEYILNLIDTPGHVDFNYEVSRSLAACEGALLIVDASQGVEAQTLANVYLAIEHNLKIIPVINKIDLPSAEIERTKKQIKELTGIDVHDAMCISAKKGDNVEQILEEVVNKVPPPKDTTRLPLRALVFDSYFENYRGIILYIRVVDGCVSVGDEILFMAKNKKFLVAELGYLTPRQVQVKELKSGDVGYLAAFIKDVSSLVGDTVTSVSNPASKPLIGYREAVPMVFCGLYTIDSDMYPDLKEALEKLKLNDSSIYFEPETSVALGFGFRCGFLGLLHMEVIQERLEREYGLSLIATSPSVIYKVWTSDKKVINIDNPALLPDPTKREKIDEPYVLLHIFLPNEFVGAVMDLCQSRRGILKDMKYLDTRRVQLSYEIPLAEIITDFFNSLKSRSKGYASMDYDLIDYRESNLVKLDILVGGEIVDALSIIVHHDKAYNYGKQLALKLKEIIPRQLFEVPIQAAIGSKIIARETVGAMRKNVLAKCYGGDVTRKKKLLEKQKEGKKKMKSIGKIDIPQEAFMAVLKLESE